MTDPENDASQNVARTMGMTLVQDDFTDEHGVSHIYALQRPQ
jgi:hypothetical protein